MTVSPSRLTPWAAPAASFIRRPISSKNRLVVWVISKYSPLSWPMAHRTHDTPETMAIPAPRFKPAMPELSLSCSYFLAIVLNGQAKKQKHNWQETPMIDQQVEIETKDGKTTTFITHPERGGPFPVILFYMDAPAIREELRDMARRLGTSGYHVMLPNMYYRSGVMELGPISPDPEAPERKRMFGFMNSINIPLVMEDTKALLAYAATQKAANTAIVGTVGYCMSGRYAVNAATHFPDQVKAA